MEKYKRNEKGFSLIELLVVMVILSLLAAIVGPTVIKHLNPSEKKAAKIQIGMLENALDTYRLNVGKYPTVQQGLKALVEKPANARRWNGPYIKKRIPKDPWGNAYIYIYPGEHGDYDIVSYGADEQPGGEDENEDVVSWKNLGEE